MPGTLYLLPNRIADRPVEETIPLYTLNILRHTQYFLAENAKSARTYLKAAEHPMPIASLHVTGRKLAKLPSGSNRLSKATTSPLSASQAVPASQTPEPILSPTLRDTNSRLNR